jgi:hypothetical protein
MYYYLAEPLRKIVHNTCSITRHSDENKELRLLLLATSVGISGQGNAQQRTGTRYDLNSSPLPHFSLFSPPPGDYWRWDFIEAGARLSIRKISNGDCLIEL